MGPKYNLRQLLYQTAKLQIQKVLFSQHLAKAG